MNCMTVYIYICGSHKVLFSATLIMPVYAHPTHSMHVSVLAVWKGKTNFRMQVAEWILRKILGECSVTMVPCDVVSSG